ncbi:hypothetical protein A2U01_0010051 [Trifolium medium]|uniref:Uncharacterized protein n=1 Tax=Trifolium medium TaxID=97028 RepID=A0A392MR56_9FABA|nr:hypothetical protein [Trifolium medium]
MPINCKGRRAYALAHYFLSKAEDSKSLTEDDDYWTELVTECQEYYDDKCQEEEASILNVLVLEENYA